MRRMIALAAVIGLFLAAPVFAQQIETLPSGKKVKIVEKEDGTVIILPVDESADSETDSTDTDTTKSAETKSAEEEFEEIEIEDDFDGELPQRVKDLLERLRKDLEEPDENPGENQPRGKIVPWGEDKDMPEDMRKAMDEMRKRMEKFRKEAEERFEKLRKEMEENWGNDDGNWEDDPDAEIEEYEKEAPDGSWKVKVKIVRKTSKSEGSTPETLPETLPETPKKSESERKQ